ncbi:5'/3'-nucleotidase SurE [Telmatospirillum sp.]|uniref:5'/3'-nucleotidase SurE n=1 Tax=Telmatospirillum sp. TaxID=2079197 RepID=UPI002849D0AE|nr:5'/3'-nucleotidase SurE [Telmatospirillum sp.]MDR3435998.1 5'/3'-nucleotidase SurE [Telmatospirillum sp.]
MFEPIADLSLARILVSNDDGIEAPGIKVLERIARSLSKDVWVVAPSSEQSAVAHSLTVRRPLRIIRHGRRRFAVDGTPTDSVLLGVRQILGDKRPDLLLSGINRGCNMADDVTYSGTVAAAMEGTLLGVRSIALSQQMTNDEPVRWDTAEHWAAPIIERVTAVGWPCNVLINVNFPDMPAQQVDGVDVVRQGKRKIGDELTERIDPRGQPYYWVGGQRVEELGDPGTDLSAVNRGKVSVSPLCVDFTSVEAMDRLAMAFR